MYAIKNSRSFEYLEKFGMYSPSSAVRKCRSGQSRLKLAVDNYMKVLDKKERALKKLARGSNRSSCIYVLTPFLSEKILAISDNSRSVMMKGIRLLEKNGKTYIFHVFGASGGWHVDTLVLTPNLYKLAYSEALQSMVPLKKIQKKKTA